MKISKELLEQAHAQGMYIDHTTGEVYPAIPREDFMAAISSVQPDGHTRLFYCTSWYACGDCVPLNTPVLLLYTTVNTNPVAAYLAKTGVLFRFDYYSPKVTYSVNKFAALIASYYGEPRRVDLYRRNTNPNKPPIELEPFVPFT